MEYTVDNCLVPRSDRYIHLISGLPDSMVNVVS